MSEVVFDHSRMSHLKSNCLATRRYQLPDPYFSHSNSHGLRHPNQAFTSSPLSVYSSSSSLSSSLSSMNSDTENSENNSDNENRNVNTNDSALSIEGEVDLRVEVISQPQQLQQPQQPQPQPQISLLQLKPLPLFQKHPSSRPKVSTPPPAARHVIVNIMSSSASAPPLSDDDNELNHDYRNQEEQKQQEETCVCIICYEDFEAEQPVATDQSGQIQTYTTEELEDIEANKKISNFCRTCKYDVHHRCIDEYRISKITDTINDSRSPRQRQQRIQVIPIGTFGIKCLLCSRQVEKIHVSRNGNIDIIRTQGDSDSNHEHIHPNEQQQEQIQNLQDIIQRRRIRRARMYCLKDKMCTICFCLLLLITVSVLLFRILL